MYGLGSGKYGLMFRGWGCGRGSIFRVQGFGFMAWMQGSVPRIYGLHRVLP